MRIHVETPESSFDADTIDHEPDLDGDFEVLADDGELLIVHGWACEIDIVDEEPSTTGWYAVAA